MELDALIVADAVSTPPDGKFYVHGGGFSRYEISSLPAPLPLGVLIRLKVDEADLGRSFTFRVTLFGPTGVPNIAPVEVMGEIATEQIPHTEGEERVAHIAIQMQPVAVRLGVYRLQLDIDGTPVRSMTIPVMLVDERSGALTPHGEWPQSAPAARAGQGRAAKARPAAKAKRPPPPPRKKKRR